MGSHANTRVSRTTCVWKEGLGVSMAQREHTRWHSASKGLKGHMRRSRTSTVTARPAEPCVENTSCRHASHVRLAVRVENKPKAHLMSSDITHHVVPPPSLHANGCCTARSRTAHAEHPREASRGRKVKEATHVTTRKRSKKMRSEVSTEKWISMMSPVTSHLANGEALPPRTEAARRHRRER